MRTFALIPAAGKSTRMGRPKLSLPLGERTVLGHVIAALRRANIDHVLVVIGPHVPELVPIVEAADAEYLLLKEETPDMRATVEAGLRHIEERYSPQPGDAMLLVPGDHPRLNSGVVSLLLEARAGNPKKSIFIPTHQGKRGHPALIDWQHMAGIGSLPPTEGLNRYFRCHDAGTLEVPTDAAEVLVDLDTPDDYDLLRSPGWQDIFYQLAAMFLAVVVGSILGFLMSGDESEVAGGAVFGFIGGLFVCALLPSLTRWVRSTQNPAGW